MSHSWTAEGPAARNATPGIPLPLLTLAACLTLLPACSLVQHPAAVRTPANPPASVERVPDAVPRPEPRSEHGNPPYYDALGKRYYVMASADGYVETGVASWYGPTFQAKHTSSGEIYDMYGMTAAHKTLPLPTYARVTNLSNGRSVVVRINDRGPFVANRIIDLSYTAAAKLDMLRDGTAVVEVRAITGPGPLPPAPLLQASQPPPAGPPPARSAAGQAPRPAPLTATLPAQPVPEQVPDSVQEIPAPADAPGAAAAAVVPSVAAAAAGAAGAAASPAASQPPAALPESQDDSQGDARAGRPAPVAAAAGAEPPSAAPGKAIYLQAGAFSDPRNAQAVLAKLRAAGVPGAFVLAPGAAGTLFRVRMGPLSSVSEIDHWVEKLAALGFAAARVVTGE